MYVGRPKSAHLSGFTITEMLVTVAISGIILVGISMMMVEMAKRNQSFITKTDKAADNRISSKVIIDVVSAAGVSRSYQHLPIKANCSSCSDAAVRKLNTSTMRFENVTAGSPIPAVTGFNNGYIQFFRDDYGQIVNKDLDTSTRLVKTEPFEVAENITSQNLYATWPLTNSSSPEFSMLVHSQLNKEYMMYANVQNEVKSQTAFAQVATVSSNNYFFVRTDQTDISQKLLDTMVGQIMMVYNAADPSQYFFQVIDSAYHCAGFTTSAECGTAYTDFTGDAPPSDFSAYPIVLRLRTVDGAYLSDYTIPSTEPAGMGNPNYGAGLTYFFPTNSATLYKHNGSGVRLPEYVPGTAYDLVPRFFGARLQAGENVSLVMIPVDAIKFKIGKFEDGSSASCGSAGVKCSLWMEQYNYFPNKVVKKRLVDELSGSIVIGRHVGTSELSFFGFEGFSVNKWCTNCSGGGGPSPL